MWMLRCQFTEFIGFHSPPGPSCCWLCWLLFCAFAELGCVLVRICMLPWSEVCSHVNDCVNNIYSDTGLCSSIICVGVSGMKKTLHQMPYAQLYVSFFTWIWVAALWGHYWWSFLFQEASTPVLDFTAKPWHLLMTLGMAVLCLPPQRGLETARCQRAIPASSLLANPSPHLTLWLSSINHRLCWTRPRLTRGECKSCSLKTFSCFIGIFFHI